MRELDAAYINGKVYTVDKAFSPPLLAFRTAALPW